MRLLGLDIGTHRIGVALSDESRTIAEPVASLDAKAPFKELLSRIKALVVDNDVGGIVVGMPLTLNGEEGGKSARMAKKTGDRLGDALEIDVIYWDERFTTAQAERMLIDASVSRAKRRKVIDKVAASLILQGYLDSQKLHE